MSIAFDSSDQWDDAANNLVGDSVVVPSLTDGILIVAIAEYEPGGDTAMDGVDSDQDGAFTQLGSNVNNNSANASLWYLLSPTAATHSIDLTPGDGAERPISGIWALFSGVDQTTPFGTPTTNTGTDDSPTVTATTASGEVVVSSGACQPASSYVAGADQTPLGDNVATAGSNIRGWSDYQDGADGGVMSGTLGQSRTWAVIAASLKPAVAEDEGGELAGADPGHGAGPGHPLAGGGGKLLQRSVEKLGPLWVPNRRLVVPVGIQIQGA